MLRSVVFVGLLLGLVLVGCTAAAVSPTADQLEWSRQEIGMLIHFNMATYIDADGCNSDAKLVPDISLFTPNLLNTDQWAQTMEMLGAKYAVLVAKHNCGFTTWPTAVNFPDVGFKYNYTIANSPVAGMDVVGSFIESCRRRSIRTGFYYSVVVNNYLNVQNGVVQNNPSPTQANITQETYDRVVLAQLTELWQQYGDLDEIWFDGGYTQSLASNITSMLNKLQPHASIFNGYGLTSNPIRWIGTEAGVAPDPNWSTGTSNDGGDPDSPVWCPAECDTTLQLGDRWFWGKDAGLRSLEEMITVYHQTVGRNCMLMLDLAPDRNGLIPPDHQQRYKELGDFIRSCYGASINATSGQSTVVELDFATPASVDRVVIQEDQTNGQVVRGYIVEAVVLENVTSAPKADVWVQVSSGSSVGNKKIDLFAAPVLASKLRLTVNKTSPNAPTPSIKNFSAHLC
eukprot:gnl/Hemi2/2691_TR946_c0_g1_i1.p1 gnl/Hemi2/2691_TR946_c0_g1~~gnl/Hemi2/2691_TR946_c0_g1_i1.p1  ORF type:complete len:464 (-),score=186.79 gnl/Hemi2/2691_TR946_c0_g1_i1:114-1481(-)